MIYGLLYFTIGKEVPRDEVTDFDTLIDKARHVENMLHEEYNAKGKNSTHADVPSTPVMSGARRRQNPKDKGARYVASLDTRNNSVTSFSGRGKKRPKSFLKLLPAKRLRLSTGSAVTVLESPVLSAHDIPTARRKPSTPLVPSRRSSRSAPHSKD